MITQKLFGPARPAPFCAWKQSLWRGWRRRVLIRHSRRGDQRAARQIECKDNAMRPCFPVLPAPNRPRFRVHKQKGVSRECPCAEDTVARCGGSPPPRASVLRDISLGRNKLSRCRATRGGLAQPV